MKPFDLEAAKRGEPIITRDGRAVKFIAHVPEASAPFRVITLPKDGMPLCNWEDGKYEASDEHGADLFMAPKRRTVWVNLYDGPWLHETESAADAEANTGRLGNKAHPIEIEE